MKCIKQNFTGNSSLPVKKIFEGDTSFLGFSKSNVFIKAAAILDDFSSHYMFTLT